MDARRDQVYQAQFAWEDGAPRRLCPDRAISLPALAGELRGLGRPIWVVGDGARLCRDYLAEAGLETILAPEAVRMQNAWGVCRAAEGKPALSAAELLPVYLRLSQAERERQERLARETADGMAPS